jgi:hypothetical protein
MLSLLMVAITACSSSQVRVPPNASLVFHGPMTDVKGSMPPGPGTMYIVDAATNRVAAAFYVPGPDVKGQAPQVGGLQQGKTYTIYFAPSSETAPSTVKAVPEERAGTH